MNSKIAVVVIPFFFFQYKELLHMYKTVSKKKKVDLTLVFTFTNVKLLYSKAGVGNGRVGVQRAAGLDPGFSL